MNEEASAIHNLKATTDFGGNDMVDAMWWKEVYVSVTAAADDPSDLMHLWISQVAWYIHIYGLQVPLTIQRDIIIGYEMSERLFHLFLLSNSVDLFVSTYRLRAD